MRCGNLSSPAKQYTISYAPRLPGIPIGELPHGVGMTDSDMSQNDEISFFLNSDVSMVQNDPRIVMMIYYVTWGTHLYAQNSDAKLTKS